MELSDVFVFIEEFNSNYVRFFYEKYLKDFAPIDSYFEYPKYGGKVDFESESYQRMLDFILEKEGREFTFYFSNSMNIKCPQGIMQINKDGSICLALCTPIKFESVIYNELQLSYPNSKVFISNNIPLPRSKKEIKNLFYL